MHWVMAVIGALLGASVAAVDGGFLGFVAGALIGWQGARLAQLKRRLEAVEAEVVRRPGQTAVTPAVSPPTASAARAVPSAMLAPSTVAATPSETIGAAAETVPAASPSGAPKPVFTASEPGPARIRPRDGGPAAMPRAPREPDVAERLTGAVKRWLFEGNVPVKLGMLVLFFGVAAALKYAVDQGYVAFPIEFRLAAIAAAAFAGLIWGWRNRELRPAFGLSLQGGAIGVLLLTIFAAYRLYALVPSGIAFGLVLALVAGAAMLAVLQNAVWLAVLGFVGGYLAPVLISTGSGNHVALFTYYAVLNAAVFGIAWKRPWRALNLIGFGFTFVVGTMWGAKYYRPEHFTTVEPFLILFFLFYVAIAVLYALRGPDARKPFVDGTLIFGTPLIAFPLQAALMGDDRMGLAYSALAVALLYLLLATWLIRRRGLALLGQTFAALAVGFATLAVPLALSSRATSASWALEGAALVWLGLRQRRWLPQFAGWALQGLAALAYFFSLMDNGWSKEPAEMAVINGHALGVGLMALSAFFISWMVERQQGHRLLVWLAFALGAGWWTVAGVRELIEHFDHLDASLAFVAFAALTAALAGLLRGLIPWPRLGWLVLAVAVLGPLLVLGTEMDLDGAVTLKSNLYWLVWFGAMVFGLIRLRDPHQRGLSLAHVAVLATAAWLYGAALHEWASRNVLDDGWRYVAGLMPLIALLLATWRAPALGAFPLANEFPRYRMRWFVPALTVLAIAWTAALAERGGSYPLPYLPLMNPIELFQLVVLVVALSLSRQHGAAADAYRPALAIATFAFLTFAGLRAVHHYTGATWSPSILDDRIAQATLTVLWSMLGVTAWIYGSRRRLWNVWLTGAILMGVVLAKLVLIDRQYVGNLAGIVSFMAVGALLVLVGRIAPTPPRSRIDASETPDN